jgi:hypothetical protein
MIVSDIGLLRLFARLSGLETRHFFLFAASYCHVDQWSVISSPTPYDFAHRYIVLRDILQPGDSLHQQFFIDLLSGDSPLQQIQRGGEALVGFFSEMNELVGSFDEMLGLSGEALTLA